MATLFCARCGSRRLVAMHHKLFLSRGGSDNPINLVALCQVCHKKVHEYKGEWTKRLRTHRHQKEGETEEILKCQIQRDVDFVEKNSDQLKISTELNKSTIQNYAEQDKTI